MCHPHGLGEPPLLAGVRRRDLALSASGGSLPVRVCMPEGPAWGAVVIASDIYGANRFYKGVAERLAEAGCAAILPDLFFREGPLPEVTREAAFARRAQLDDERALADLGASLDWLVDESGSLGATLGFCLGGNLVFHMTTRRHDRATVAYYGFPAGLPAPNGLPRPLSIVEDLSGPILAFWGEGDEKVGMHNVEEFRRAAESASVDYEQRVYPDVGHGFLAGLDEDAIHPAHAPARDSWDRMLAFLRRQLERK